MDSNLEDTAVIRRFLLGESSQAERTQVEWRHSADAEYRELVQSIEEEIIDEYLLGVLAPAQRQLFEQSYLISEARRQKVKEARILHEALNRSSKPTLGLFRWIVVIAVIGLATAVSIVWWQQSKAREVSLTLTEGVTRGLASDTIHIHARVLLVRLVLHPDSSELAEEASIETADSDRQLWRQRVTQQSDSAVHVLVPAAVLDDGDYIVSLESQGKRRATFFFRVHKE